MEWKRARPTDQFDMLSLIAQRQKVELPKEYVEIAMNHNAAIPHPNTFLVDGEEYSWERLISIDPAETFNIKSACGQFDEGSHIFPFGIDSFGNYLCFCDESTFTVAFYFHEEDRFVNLASSFSQFLQSLY